MAISANAETVTASQYSFAASVDLVAADTGAGVFTGTEVGDSFSGVFNYGLSADDIDETESLGPDEVLHAFWRYPSSLDRGGASAEGWDTWIGTLDNLVLDQENADFLNTLTGSSLSAGDEVDGWSAESESPGTVYQNDELYDGVVWLLTIGMAPDFYDSLDFRAEPPPLASAVLAFFEVIEVREGVEVFAAYGNLTGDNYTTGPVELAPVPVPAAAWLFGSALGLLGWARRRAH